MTRRICSKVKSRTTDRAPWDCLSCAYSSVQISSIFQSKLVICSYSALPGPGVFGPAQVGMSGEVASRGRQVTVRRRKVCTGANHAHVACYSSRVATSRHPDPDRPSSCLESHQELSRSHLRTQIPQTLMRDRRRRYGGTQIVYWRVTNKMTRKRTLTSVRYVALVFMSTSFRHLTHAHRRLPRRFV